MRQPEGDARLDEETILKRLSEFRAGNTREVTPLNFFDELDIHPLVVCVKDHLDYGMKGPYSAVALRMGRPCRYGKLLGKLQRPLLLSCLVSYSFSLFCMLYTFMVHSTCRSCRKERKE